MRVQLRVLIRVCMLVRVQMRLRVLAGAGEVQMRVTAIVRVR